MVGFSTTLPARVTVRLDQGDAFDPLEYPGRFRGVNAAADRTQFHDHTCGTRGMLMCGVCGVMFHAKDRHVNKAVLRRMNDTIRHRGPDEDGFHIRGNIGLAMRRLSIIDIAGGSQPVYSEDGEVVVVFNGEIYNFQQLRNALEGRGHRFATRSDTEVLVHAYEEYGRSFVSKLRGMFAFALYDARTDEGLLAIDRFGIKPLYYAADPGGLVFGSELKAVLASGQVQRHLDYEALSQYFTLGYIPPPLTVFAGVRKLEPATMLRWARARVPELARYWSPLDVEIDRRRSVGETREALLAALRDSVRSHLVSDVPLGAFLSGGIDSSTVVALMSEASSEPVKTFSIGFTDPRFDERDKARLVAERFGTDHHELIVEPEGVDLLPRIVQHFDEPFADSSALPTYYVSKLARSNLKVALSGDGGDEFFVGYRTFRGVDLARRLQGLPEPVRVAVGRASRFPTTPQATLNDRLGRLSKQVADSLTAPAMAYTRKITPVGLPAVTPFLGDDFAAALQANDPLRIVNEALATPVRHHPLEPFIHAGASVSLPGDMLVKVDRMSMANSLEVRVPFLDHQLVEFAQSVPLEQRFPRWRLKGLLKDTMDGILPRELLRQKKQGFGAPLASWFRGSIAGFAEEVLTDTSATSSGLIDTGQIPQLIEQHRSGTENLGGVIWSLLVFELWTRSISPSA